MWDLKGCTVKVNVRNKQEIMGSEMNLNVKCNADFTTAGWKQKNDFAHPYPAMKYENILLWYYDIILLFLNAAEFYIT
jgi:hypothetical protein